MEAKTIKEITVISNYVNDTAFTLQYVTDEEITDIIDIDYTTSDFPHTLQEKEKIKKFMFVKIRIKSDNGKKLNFYKIGIKYVLSGRYRGDA